MSTPVARRNRERSTRQKRALAAALASSATFRSAQDLFAELRAAGEDIGLTTIYSQLNALAEAGDIDVVRADDGEVLYRRCATDSHHHHLLCRVCGRTVEVESAEVEQWAGSVAAAAGFTDVTHTLEVRGVCPDCS